jgi:hypothetical protein
MLSEAHEYRETQALNKMSPEEREKYHLQTSRRSVNEYGRPPLVQMLCPVLF